MDSEKEKFLSKVNQTNDCWLWIHSVDSHRYGKYDGQLAHRVSYTLFNGSISKGLCVCHRCDNPMCVKPEHLFLGTQADNIRDRHTKGRTANGEQLAKKLSEKQAWFIKYSTLPPRELRKMFPVGPSIIYDIRHNIKWKHI